MSYTYKTKGTCSTQIQFDLEDNKVRNVRFTGGCNGNLQAVSRLVEGMTVDEISQKCEGIKCGFKNTSCADQLVKGIQQALRGESNA